MILLHMSMLYWWTVFIWKGHSSYWNQQFLKTLQLIVVPALCLFSRLITILSKQTCILITRPTRLFGNTMTIISSRYLHPWVVPSNSNSGPCFWPWHSNCKPSWVLLWGKQTWASLPEGGRPWWIVGRAGTFINQPLPLLLYQLSQPSTGLTKPWQE